MTPDDHATVNSDDDDEQITLVLRSVWRECYACGGTGYWPNQMGERFECLACSGHGKIHDIVHAVTTRGEVRRLKAEQQRQAQ